METTTHIKSLGEHIKSLAEVSPGKSALLTCDSEGSVIEEVSYEQLSRKIGSAHAYFRGLGLKKGDKIALAFKNSAELLILSWAAWSEGIVTVPLDTKRDTSELYEYKITLNKAKLLIVQKGIFKEGENREIEGVKTVEFSGFLDGSDTSVVEEPGLSHLALVLFTSGTTAYPKGAKLTLENLIVNAQGILEWLNITDEDRFLVNLPLHHINSTTFCLATLLAGGSIAIPPAYSNSHFWQQAAKTKSTLTSIVQSIVFDQLSRIDEFAAVKNALKLNRIQIGSAPVMAQTALEFIKKFGIPLYQGYGQTETALRVTGVPMGLPKNLYEQLIEENSIGAPMSWADLRIADESGNFLGENQEGELVIKGPAVMEGYVADEPAFRDLPAPRPGSFYVYVIKCDNDSFYIGQTKNLFQRWEQHRKGTAAEHTKKHKPIEIIHHEEYPTLEEAVQRERELKTGFGRKWLKREYKAGRTRQAGGYFLTGDIGIFKVIDGRQYFFLKGRKKEMIIKGGINISPVAVENHLKKISDDIEQAYVIGFPDERYGEEVAAVICWRKGIDEESAKRRLKLKLLSGTPLLSSYETPKYISTIASENLPLTSTGKVQRTVLKIKTPADKFEPVHELLHTDSYTFSILGQQSPLFADSCALHNHCWQPIATDIKKYKEDMNKLLTLLAIDKNGKLAGQIAFIRTNLSSDVLLNTSYDKLLSPEVSNSNGKAVVCVSICSADYEPKPIPSVSQIPDSEMVMKYLEEVGDPVLRFHQKPKGGLDKGAALVGVIPNGRPEDKSSLGYNMLLKYPAPSDAVAITNGAPVSNQLIEAVLLLAKDVGINDVYAYSRPGGLASYVAGQT